MRRYRTSVTPRGAGFIANFEGYRGHPYRDAVGVWTIGYGHTENVGPGTRPISQAAAEQLLAKDLNRKYAPPVAKLTRALGLRLEPHEFNALVSLAYNLGPGVLDRGRSMGDALRTKNRRKIADAFLPYDKAGGRALAGLTRRRHAERTLFLTSKDVS